MPEENIWSQISKDKKFMVWALRIIVIIVIAFLLIVTFRACNGDEVNVFGIQLSSKKNDTVVINKSNPDTTHINVFETTYTPIRVLPDNKIKPFSTAKDSKKNSTSSIPNNSMKIDSGGSGIQNNAPNYGNQAGRDLYVQAKTLTPNEIFLMVAAVKFFSKAYHTAEIVVPMGANTNKMVAQVEEALYPLGFSGDKNTLSVFYAGDVSESDDITYDTSHGKISIMLFCK